MWKRFIRNYFTFTRRERNGLIVLLMIMLIIAFWPRVYLLFHEDEPTDFTLFQRQIDSFNRKAETNSSSPSSYDSAGASLAELNAEQSASEEIGFILFPFNPNTIGADEWRKLGLSNKTIQTIINYRSKGGKFFKKEDLKKIYGFKETDYKRLEPYIDIPATIPVVYDQKPKIESKSTITTIVELNAADSAQLTGLNGIGTVLSSRIIKFRNRIGGFNDLEQLKEVYGLSPETFELVKDKVSVNSSKIKKLNINTIDLNALKQHPYFKNPIALTVISYREQHGFFNAQEDLKNVDLITDEIYQKKSEHQV